MTVDAICERLRNSTLENGESVQVTAGYRLVFMPGHNNFTYYLQIYVMRHSLPTFVTWRELDRIKLPITIAAEATWLAKQIAQHFGLIEIVQETIKPENKLFELIDV
ncbi:MAG: hypothetical protein WAZ14_01025 [Patescibacteria group bacterium]